MKSDELLIFEKLINNYKENNENIEINNDREYFSFTGFIFNILDILNDRTSKNDYYNFCNCTEIEILKRCFLNIIKRKINEINNKKQCR